MIISVTQFNNCIKGILDSESMLSSISIKGEICNLRDSYDAVYFTLKDENSALDCYAKKSTKTQLLRNGAEFVCVGNPSFYTKTAKLSFTVTTLQPCDNLGEQYLRLLKLKERLQKEGLFDDTRKKQVPRNCVNIGVVTSEKGAVIADITGIALRRNPSVNIYLYPVKVQGEGAEMQIAKGISYFSSLDVDAVIIARGGGSNEDLSSFDSELVVRAVANCNKPTVSAVGHNIDFTLCDYAADLRAATPSEAAELITQDVELQKAQCIRLLTRSLQITESILRRTMQQCKYALLKQYSHCLEQNTLLRQHINEANLRLDKVNIIKKFQQGYALVSKNGVRLNNISQVAVGEEISITTNNGEITAIITSITKR